MATYNTVATFRRDVWPVTGHSAPERIVQLAAELAYDVINARMYGHYEVPFAATYPSLIVNIANLLTKHFCIILAQKERVPVVLEEDSAGRTLYGAAMHLLGELARGNLELPSVARLSYKAAYIPHSDKMPIFNLDSVFNHYLDPDQLEEIEDEREV